MKVDFHTHTNRSIDAIPSPRQLVKQAKEKGLDAIAITDHNRFFPKSEAQRLTREFGILVIPGMEGGQIAVRKHWIATGIDHLTSKSRIDHVLSAIRQEGGLSIAPHPHTRLGYADYALLGFDAVESLNGSEPEANRLINNTSHIPEVAGSDAHALPMLGYTWTNVDADPTVESILESVRKGRCRPMGDTIPVFNLIRFYPQFITHRILREPRAAFAHARKVIREVRMIRACESYRTDAEHNHIKGDQISQRCIPAHPLDWR
jgi:predicted metal-dependent phosphoesterase TrpH